MTVTETVITIIGNLVEDPSLRFTPAGQPVERFRVASTLRRPVPSGGVAPDRAPAQTGMRAGVPYRASCYDASPPLPIQGQSPPPPVG